MKAGRELDALVAEKVMGFRRVSQPADYDGLHKGEPVLFPANVDDRKFVYPPKGKVSLGFFVPYYSTDIADAWLVVEKIEKDYYPFVLMVDRYGGAYSKGEWLCSFTSDPCVFEDGPHGSDTDAMEYWYEPHSISAGSTPAHAICLAALKAVGVEV